MDPTSQLQLPVHKSRRVSSASDASSASRTPGGTKRTLDDYGNSGSTGQIPLSAANLARMNEDQLLDKVIPVNEAYQKVFDYGYRQGHQAAFDEGLSTLTSQVGALSSNVESVRGELDTFKSTVTEQLSSILALIQGKAGPVTTPVTTADSLTAQQQAEDMQALFGTSP